MWNELLENGLEKIFRRQTSAFEIGGQIVQTTVSGNATPQAVGKASMESVNLDINDPSLVCYIPESAPARHYVQLGFNPFTPVIQKGAEELLKILDYGQPKYD